MQHPEVKTMNNILITIGRTFRKVEDFLLDLGGYEVWPRKEKKQEEEPLCCQNELSSRNALSRGPGK